MVEIIWNSTCEQLQRSVGHCGVRYRTEEDQVWFEVCFLFCLQDVSGAMGQCPNQVVIRCAACLARTAAFLTYVCACFPLSPRWKKDSILAMQLRISSCAQRMSFKFAVRVNQA